MTPYTMGLHSSSWFVCFPRDLGSLFHAQMVMWVASGVLTIFFLGLGSCWFFWFGRVSCFRGVDPEKWLCIKCYASLAGCLSPGWHWVAMDLKSVWSVGDFQCLASLIFPIHLFCCDQIGFQYCSGFVCSLLLPVMSFGVLLHCFFFFLLYYATVVLGLPIIFFSLESVCVYSCISSSVFLGSSLLGLVSISSWLFFLVRNCSCLSFSSCSFRHVLLLGLCTFVLSCFCLRSS